MKAESRKRFDDILKSLDVINIPYEVDTCLVRGLDYYSHTIFEFLEKANEHSNLGSQNTILAGGRYDDLTEMLGATRMQAIGFRDFIFFLFTLFTIINIMPIRWAAGVDRLALILDRSLLPEKPPMIGIVILREANTPPETLSLMENTALKLSHELCTIENICVLFAGEGTAKKQMSRANKYNAQFTIIIGESEIASKEITFKNMINGSQERISIDNVLPTITSLLSSK